MTNDVPTLDGRPGRFVVGLLPDGENEDGEAVPVLTRENADREANKVPGPAGIFWEYGDESREGEEPVRHFVGRVPYNRPILTGQEMEMAHREWVRLLSDPEYADKPGALEQANRLVERSSRAQPVGVWAVCEAWLIARGPASLRLVR